MQITLDIKLDGVVDVLSDYFGITLPEAVIVDILTTNGQVLGEVVDNSIRDTYARDILIEAVTEHVGADTWPTYGEKRDTEVFYAQLKEKLEAVGGTFVHG